MLLQTKLLEPENDSLLLRHPSTVTSLPLKRFQLPAIVYRLFAYYCILRKPDVSNIMIKKNFCYEIYELALLSMHISLSCSSLRPCK